MKLNRKGFTLVEVILAVAIMSILTLTLVPSVMVLVDKNKEKSCNSMRDNIKSAAMMYVTYNKYNLGFTCGSTKNITLKMLIDSGDLKANEDGKIINPVNDEEISLNTVVEVTYDCDIGTFTYVVDGIYCSEDEENAISGSISSNGNSFLSGIVGTKNIKITDSSSGACASAIEYYYEDDNYRYYFTCIKSSSIMVTVDGVTYTIKEALNSGVVTMSELESVGFTPLKEVKNNYTS